MPSALYNLVRYNLFCEDLPDNFYPSNNDDHFFIFQSFLIVILLCNPLALFLARLCLIYLCLIKKKCCIDLINHNSKERKGDKDHAQKELKKHS